MTAAEKRKVLIVDDNILDVMDAEEKLDEVGYGVVKLSTPHGIIAKIDHVQPDVLLLDISMARLNVDQVLDSLRVNPDHEEMVIVLFSDIEAETLQQICLDKDVHGYFCKSMDISRIATFLDNFFERE